MCIRTPLTGNASVGHDDCAAGLWCSGLGFPDDPVAGVPTMRACRSWCRASTDCDMAGGEQCVALGDLTPQDGFCLPTCPLWGTTCTDGMACQYLGTIEGAAGPAVGYCGTAGPVPINGDCTVDACAADLLCITNNMTMETSCRAMCDTAGGAAGTHPCPAGQTCGTFQDAPAGFGICG
jgi:hypothetical protein